MKRKMTPLRGVRADVGIRPYGKSIEVRPCNDGRTGSSAPTDEHKGCDAETAGGVEPRPYTHFFDSVAEICLSLRHGFAVTPPSVREALEAASQREARSSAPAGAAGGAA